LRRDDDENPDLRAVEDRGVGKVMIDSPYFKSGFRSSGTTTMASEARRKDKALMIPTHDLISSCIQHYT
jgi:hypothetical protein